MKKLLIILVLFFPKVLIAYECEFEKLVPGKTKKQLEELNIYPMDLKKMASLYIISTHMIFV